MEGFKISLVSMTKHIEAKKGLNLVRIRILRRLYHYLSKLSIINHVLAIDSDQHNTSN